MPEPLPHRPLDLPNPPYLLTLRSSKPFILTTVCAAIFTDSIIYGILVPILPFSLRTRSGVQENDIQWWTSFILGVYGLMQCLGSPIAGYYADHSANRRNPFFLGLIVLGAATVLFGLATEVWVLILSRSLQGLSTAVVFSVGFAVVTDTVGREEIGLWMGTVLSCNTLGLLVSPPLGGLVYRKAGYAAVFWVVLAFIAVDVILRLLMIERKTAEKYYSSTGREGITESSGTSYGTFGDALLSSRDQSPKRSDTPSIHSSSSPPLTPLEDKSPSTLPPVLTLLSSPRYLSALYGSFINIATLVAFDGVLPLFVKRTFHWSSLGAGLVFLNISLPQGILSPVVGQVSDKLGPKWISVAGFVLTAPSLVALRFVSQDSQAQVLLLCGLLVLTGACSPLPLSSLILSN
jgi:MFS family permease